MNLTTGTLCRSLIAFALCSFTQVAQAEIAEKDFSAAMAKYVSNVEGREALANAVQQYMSEDAKFRNIVDVPVGTSPVRGPATAKVTIVEFSDFQCPYCKRGKESMDKVLKDYPNDVKFSFKNLPLPFHQQAKPAALATIAANKQGKFWEFHDALFDNQDKLNAKDTADAYFIEAATKLGLNVEQFKKDLESDESKKTLEADMELGKKLGIQGTPAFFVNGISLPGALPPAEFKKIIDKVLAGKVPAAAKK